MATLPPILVELKANASELTAKLGEVQSDFQKTASEGQSMASKIKDHFGAISTAVTGALGGAGLALANLGSNDQAAKQQLDASLQTMGQSFGDFKDQIESTISSNEKFGHDAADTQNALTTLNGVTGDMNTSLGEMQTVANLAAAKHESLADAAKQVSTILGGGGVKTLKQYGIQVRDNADGTKDYQGAIDALGLKLQGQAAAASDTFTGKLTAIKTHVEDVAASIGQKYGPAVTLASGGVSVLSGVVGGASKVIGLFKSGQEAATVATEGMTAATEAGTVATDAATVSEGLALLPILAITAAVVAVGVGIYELWNNWSTVWGLIKGAAEAVWNWIKNNWPLLLGILTGPIGLAVVEIIRHWNDIKSAFSAVVSWIGDRIDDIVSFFEGLPGRISRAVAHAFDGLVSAFGNAVTGMLKSVPGGGIVSSVLGHLPGFATGGPISAGQLSIVGENGPELFLPGQSGTIVPNGALGGGNVSVGSIVINGASDPAAVAKAVRDEIIRMKRSNVNGGLS